MNLLTTTLGRLRIVGFLEGVSFLVLLGIAMPLKYIWQMPEAVKVTGMLHGILFVSYGFLVLQAKIEYSWSFKKMGLALVASILPFGPFIADKKLFKVEEMEPSS
jgi:integral membrane protein